MSVPEVMRGGDKTGRAMLSTVAAALIIGGDSRIRGASFLSPFLYHLADVPIAFSNYIYVDSITKFIKAEILDHFLLHNSILADIPTHQHRHLLPRVDCGLRVSLP